MTPRELGYYFPPEWAPHAATWLSWPHKEDSWPGKLNAVFPAYAKFVKEVATGEKVYINVNDKAMRRQAEEHLVREGADLKNIDFFLFPTNDAWCRDYGPAFLLHRNEPHKRAVIDWKYNAWGDKYPPYDQDDILPKRISEHYNIPCFEPGIVMEGGSVDFNGHGTLLTTEGCLLNQNRNPHLKKEQIERYLIDYYGVEQVLWLGEGIIGDDTDGHVDDLTRFVNVDTVVTVIETQRSNPNYAPLQDNLKALKNMRLANGKPLNIIEMPMPNLRYEKDHPLPCSYANFYICNAAVIVPIFNDANDEKALEVLSACFPNKKVVGIDSTDIIWGLGSFHCLSQQEPV
jgi:agmatine deiminase